MYNNLCLKGEAANVYKSVLRIGIKLRTFVGPLKHSFRVLKSDFKKVANYFIPDRGNNYILQ